MRKLIVLWLVFMLLCSGCGKASEQQGNAAATVAMVTDVQRIPGWETIEKGFEADQDIGLMGYMIFDVYQADLNGDGTLEVYVNSVAGSGIIHQFVQCYDAASDTYSMLNDRMVTDYYVVEHGGELFIIARPYIRDGQASVCRAALMDGCLACGEIDAALQEEVLEAQPD